MRMEALLCRTQRFSPAVYDLEQQ